MAQDPKVKRKKLAAKKKRKRARTGVSVSSKRKAKKDSSAGKNKNAKNSSPAAVTVREGGPDSAKKRVSFSSKVKVKKHFGSQIQNTSTAAASPASSGDKSPKSILKRRGEVDEAALKRPAETTSTELDSPIPKIAKLAKKSPSKREKKASGGETPANKGEVKIVGAAKLLKKKERVKRLRELKRTKRPLFDLIMDTKRIWEKLRSKKTKPAMKLELGAKLYQLIQGRVCELVYAHDSARVLQCLVALKNEEINGKVFEEFKSDIIKVSKAKYGRFFMAKFLKHGSEQVRREIFEAFSGHFPDLVRHSYACDLVETLYDKPPTPNAKAKMVAEFFGREVSLFYAQNPPKSIGELPEEKQPAAVESLKTHILELASKPALRHSIVHKLCAEFFAHVKNASVREEVVDALKERAVEILHTRDGAHAMMHCLWFGSVKVRKLLVKSMLGLVKKMCFEQYGHLVLLAAFDCVDDTVLLQKVVFRQIEKDLLEIVNNNFGLKVVLYLLHPRDPMHFNNSTIDLLSQGDANPFTKKDAKIRYQELKSAITDPLISLVAEKMEDFIVNRSLLVLAVWMNLPAEKLEPTYTAFARLAARPFVPFADHVIEQPRAHFVLKHVLKEVRRGGDGKAVMKTFQEILVDTVPKEHFGDWIGCNRGCFVLHALLECGISGVVSVLEQVLTESKYMKQLKSYSSAGAKLLLQRLKK